MLLLPLTYRTFDIMNESLVVTQQTHIKILKLGLGFNQEKQFNKREKTYFIDGYNVPSFFATCRTKHDNISISFII